MRPANAAQPGSVPSLEPQREPKARGTGCSDRSGTCAALHQERIMLGWAITFLIVALVAALFGFGGIAAVAVDAAKIIFFVAIILFVVSAVVMLIRGRSPTLP
jgi:uncharacterized membrane protein YtjA (UPF0391 family)